MKIQDYQLWVRQFYQKQGWYDRNPFMRITYLTEEIGEVACAVRDIELGRERPDETDKSKRDKINHSIEELGDALDNIFILADKYGIDMEEVIIRHQQKFEQRYH